MNSNDILRMARQSTFDDPLYKHDLVVLTRFARLVAAQEREECATLAEDHPDIAQKIRDRHDRSVQD